MTKKILKSDVIVVGYGGMGSAICYYLTLSGLNVIGIDRFSPPHQKGSSSGKTRLFRQTYFEDPRYIPLAKHSYELWKKLNTQRNFNQDLLTETGFLVLSPEKEQISETIFSYADSYNIENETLSRKQLKNSFPQFLMPMGFMGQFEKKAGIIRSDLTIETFLSLARKKGAIFKTNERVSSWENHGSEVHVVTDKSEYWANYLVLSPGPWSSDLLSPLPMIFKITRAPQFWFASKHSYKEKMPCFAVIENREFIYGFPDVDQSGLKISNYAPSDQIEGALEKKYEYKEKELKPITQVIDRFLPHVHKKPLNWKMCFYTLTKDENFLIDFHPEFKNVVLATGGSGHAFKFIPLIGDLVKKMIHSEKIEYEIDFLKLR